MIAVTADDLIALFRSQVDDNVIDVGGGDAVLLWKSGDVNAYLSGALDALATDTLELFQTFQIPAPAGVQNVEIPENILHIREAKIVGGRKLFQANANGSDRGMPAYGCSDDYGQPTPYLSDTATGTPARFVRDYDIHEIKLYPIPQVDIVVELQCSVTLDAPLDGDDPLPFKKAQDQLLLLEFMKHLAYRKQDAETEDLVRADKALAAYNAGAIKRKSELQNQRRAPGVVRMEYP